jgi:two-component system response regulator MprA
MCGDAEPMIPSAPKIVVVEDERAMRAMLELGLTREGYAVRALADGVDLVRIVTEWPADLVLLDIMLPKADGLTLLPRLRAATDVPILMLTARTETVDTLRAFGLGADDYITKPFNLDELLARIAAALRRPGLASTDVLRYGDLSVDVAARVARRGARRLDLTPREFAMLEVLVRTPGRSFRKEELLEAVWGFDFDGEVAIVDRYISYLRAKTEAAGEPRLLQTQRGFGYALRHDA